MKKLPLVLLYIFIVLLSACKEEGTGSGGTEPSPAPSVTISPDEAVRFLQQATFGPTQVDIDALQSMALDSALTSKTAVYANWVDQQTNETITPATEHVPWFDHSEDLGRVSAIRLEPWWGNALYAKDQLRQRVAFALSEIVVVSEKDAKLNQSQRGLLHYYDLLLRNSFGDYRTLLEEVSRSPVMGRYLSFIGNRKKNLVTGVRPDENYAREILQLFSIGLYELNEDGTYKLDSGERIPTYDQDTIGEFAKVFTGWCHDDPLNAGPRRDGYCHARSKGDDYHTPMKGYDSYHDANSKSLLQQTSAANQTTEQDLDVALDDIMQHPNIGPFISKQLIQRLVTSNPSPAYVKRVVYAFEERDAQGNRPVIVKGNLKAAVRAILLDDEARNGHENAATKNIFGKLREPLIRMTHMLRALNVDLATRDVTAPSGATENRDSFRVYGLYDRTAQEPLGSPSVFNFFKPSYATRNLASQDLVAPEFQINSDFEIVAFANFMFHPATIGFANNKWGSDRNLWDFRLAYYDQSNLLNIYDTNNPVKYIHNGLEGVIHWLDIFFVAGDMSDEMKQTIRKLEVEIKAKERRRDRKTDEYILNEILSLVLVSPEFAIQR